MNFLFVIIINITYDRFYIIRTGGWFFVEPFIEEALNELNVRGVSGQDVTPFLLAHIVECTEGRSLLANLALVRNNAATAAQIAVEYARLQA